MRRLLGALLLTVLTVTLTGCGDDGSPTATDPAPSSTPSASAPPSTSSPSSPSSTDPGEPPTKSGPLTPGGVPFELVEIVSGTAGRGVASEQAVPIASESDLAAFVAGFSDGLADDVREAYAANPVADGRRLYAAVVGLGCDVPPGVDVAAAGDGYTITGLKVADPRPECVAAVTSVALVAIGG